MKFRIDIDEKLDLTTFQKHAKVYMGRMRELEYDIFLKDYRIQIRVIQVDGQSQQMVSITVADIKRKDDLIVDYKHIYPADDTRFSEIKAIQSMFEKGNLRANFETTDAAATTEKLQTLIKTIHKINNLKAFL